MAEDISEAALEYHRLPTPGKIAMVATKPLGNQRDLALAYSPGVAAASLAIAADPGAGRDAHRARQSRRRHHQRHRRAGPGRHRPARRQAGDGRQGGPVQEIRRHRRLRHRDRRARPRQARRDHRRAGADLRRHQSRGHQGAGMLRDRGASSASASKIPVFHDDQHGTAIIVGAAIRNGLRLVGKSLDGGASSSPRARARRPSPASICWSTWACKVENIIVTDRYGVVWRGRKEEMDPRKERYAKDTNARTPGRSDRRRRYLPRPVRARRADARDGGEDGGHSR